MLSTVKQFIRRHDILEPGDKVVVACSGGPDSLALLHIFAGFSLEYNITVYAAHVDHMFRGRESAQEADFVENFCRQQQIVCYRTAVDVPALMKADGLSAQEAARKARYRFLQETAAQLGGAKIATGHQRDDQAETVLMNVLRGAGSTGLSGIKPVNGNVIRPLLGVGRASILEYCRKHGLEPRFDSSNAKDDYLRNDIRLNLLPMLEKQYNSSISDALCRMAEIIEAEHDFVRTAACRQWEQAVREEGKELYIDGQRLTQCHAAVQRELLRRVVERLKGHSRGIDFHHLEKLREFAVSGRVASCLQLPSDLRVHKEYDGITLYCGEKGSAQPAGVDYALQLPGVTYIPELQLTVTAELAAGGLAAGPNQAMFDLELLVLPLKIRTRQPGDRFRPLGGNGSKKLKDFLIDAKVPQAQRDKLPLICDRENIIWVGGHRQAEMAKVTQNTKKFLKITLNCNA